MSGLKKQRILISNGMSELLTTLPNKGIQRNSIHKIFLKINSK